MKYRWSLAPAQPLLAGELARRLQLSPLLVQCLLNRRLDEPEAMAAFLEPRLKHLADPLRLPGMERAVERLLAARARDEPLVIFGDYDVDGVTSTAVLLEVFQKLGWRASHYLPHRMDEGYGLSREAVRNCLQRFPVQLLLAVDCGSASREVIAELQAGGVEVLVLDHHQISDPPPPAFALVNPRASAPGAEASVSGGLELCSAGLAFKLCHALLKRGRETGLSGADTFDVRPLLDLVALGTIADLVPLAGENRILVAAGLERLRNTPRPGLIALKQAARCPARLSARDAAFQLAPRLNAAGRLETAEDALRLLRAATLAEATPLAEALDRQNRERQELERTITAEALAAVRARFNGASDYVIVEGRPHWHLGVVGIVASRVLQQFHRPTLILGGDGGHWRGSGRSVAGFDLAAALRECDGLLVRHGGHALAAGVTLAPARLEEFRGRLNAIARRQLAPEQLMPSLRLDAEVGLEELTIESLAAFERLKPEGQQNPPVQLVARGLAHQRPLQRCGARQQHVRMWFRDGRAAHEAVWWGAGEESLPVGCFDVAFAPEINEYNGVRRVRLRVLDWQPVGPAAKNGSA